ncbi:MAG: hypothetical protein LBU73_03550 [Helicobacteraceae bacterium]|jgi:hypothetical protein|nr:hypothetical protein [Helicobacteraceae bacterium]
MFSRLIFAVLLIAVAANADLGIEEYNENVMRYYEKKDAKFIDLTIAFYKSDFYKSNATEMDTHLLQFFYGIKTQDQKRFNDFFAAAKNSGDQNLIAVFEYVNKNEKSIAETRLEGDESPEQNDNYWIMFFATGDTKYLDKLFRVAMKYKDEKKFMMKYLTSQSAIWSLASNAKQLKLVKSHLTNAKILDSKLKNYMLKTDPEKIRENTIEFLKKNRENWDMDQQK